MYCTTACPALWRLRYVLVQHVTRHCDSPLTGLPDEALLDLARRLRLVPAEAAVADSGGGSSSSSSSSVRRSLLLQTLVNYFAERPSQLQRVNEMPLVPSEALLWDENQVTRQTVIFRYFQFSCISDQGYLRIACCSFLLPARLCFC